MFLNGWFSRFRTRPDFEIVRALREFKAVPTALASRSPAPSPRSQLGQSRTRDSNRTNTNI
ncbi:hypothetical protein DBQ68_09915 [Lactobacillus sp. DS15_6]|nr:hypothetical protein F0640_10385 [Lacticaseibacillus paracasei]PTS50016.1 hypothetical protein DBQ62_09170 [Lactobacillus sp. DS9_6]PTS61170.1 hypothetical protein DBQ68_09915 [Lactobacillus sp. DS15_6]PTS70115.1 hypothetical protein DBQ65_07920 [Lactobacillus sp. DS3_6]PTV39964.1 hypothetical protein DB343_09940 [Lactobacillus sp. DS18_6]